MPRDYDEDDDRPRKRRRVVDDDEDRPRSRRVRDDDDDEDQPRSRRRSDAEDDYDDRPRRKKKKKVKPQPNVLGIISIVIGIGAVLFSFIPCLGFWAIVPGGIGVLVGGIGLLVSHQSEGRYERKMPIIGLSISVVAILFGLSWILIVKHWEKKIDKGWKEAEAEMAKAEAERKKELATAATEVAAAGENGALRVTAALFARAYNQDEDQADRQYKNKVLEITGTFQEVDFNRGAGNTYSVVLRGGNAPDDTVDCEFAKNPELRARLAQLQPGQQVTIRGKCLGGTATIEACILVQPAAAQGE